VIEVRTHDEATVASLAGTLGVRPVTARCLLARGHGDEAAARAFLEPKLALLRRPEGLADFAKAVDRVAAAVLRRERIAVFGDYDVDGVTTCAVLAGFLRAAGAQVHARVARRDEGYGFSPAALHDLLAQRPGLIITGDCGTSDQATIADARGSGCDVIVVDHHTVPAAGELHPAYALVNPHRADSSFPFRGMASVGIAFYLTAAIRTRLREQGWFAQRAEPDPRAMLDLVAVGTIADLVPLAGENRILTAAGLKLLGLRQRPGLAALLAQAGVEADERVDEKTVGWKLAPRLNAPGRLGDAQPALELLLADAARAHEAAAALESANVSRRGVQDEVLAAAVRALGDGDPGPAVVIAGEGWPSGVVGIVAAKLVERYRRPAFVIAIDAATGIGRGSARSYGGVDLYAALGACAALLEGFGGHAAAAGLTVRASEVGRLREALGEAILARGSGPVATTVVADAAIELSAIDEDLVRELLTLAPFGQENPPPRLVCRGATVKASRRVGDGSHLKLELADERGALRGAIGFGLGDRDPGVGAVIDVAFTPSVSSWQGRTRVELELHDLHVRGDRSS
jgi:single-stranded-DNA-specific exonuclease